MKKDEFKEAVKEAISDLFKSGELTTVAWCEDKWEDKNLIIEVRIKNEKGDYDVVHKLEYTIGKSGWKDY